MMRAVVALSNHSLETVPIAVALMQAHDVILLEEPAEDVFLPMLKKEITIDAYMMTSETEYPEFTAFGQEFHRMIFSGMPRSIAKTIGNRFCCLPDVSLPKAHTAGDVKIAALFVRANSPHRKP